MNKNKEIFFALLRAGLWEKDVEIPEYGTTNFSEIMRLAEEQSVVGLITAGLEHVKDVKVPQEWVLQLVGSTLHIEERNKAMNAFIEWLIEKLRQQGVYSLLVKGQGIAQCYERPLWRACGDVDLLLSTDNYNAAKHVLVPMAISVEEEDEKRKHLGLVIPDWVVELHGTLWSGLWKKLDLLIDDSQKSVFFDGNVRSWKNGKTLVFLPGVNEDVIFIFSHILQHFFKEGIGLRQVCDWCRLIYQQFDELDQALLGKNLRKAGLMTEWKAFAALAVNYLGFPKTYMPYYSYDKKWKSKAEDIIGIIMDTGNFGHNRDNSYRDECNIVTRKTISLLRYTKETVKRFKIFPLDSMRVWWKIVKEGVMGG